METREECARFGPVVDCVVYEVSQHWPCANPPSSMDAIVPTWTIAGPRGRAHLRGLRDERCGAAWFVCLATSAGV
jgi:hypothetical protein